jgi:hypothetical protein
VRSGCPADLGERDPSPRIDPHTFPFQQHLLNQLSSRGGPGAYATGRVYHPVPGNDGSPRQGMECIADLAGVAGQTRQRGNLTVCGHSPLGDPPDNLVDPLITQEEPAGSGAPLHPGREENYPSHDGNPAGPGGNGFL